jgi:predicted nucleic acid-binding protein
VVIFDSAVLLLALDASAQIPNDPATRKPVDKGRERVEHLIDTLSDGRTRILIPAPVLAEVLVHAGAATAQIVAKFRTVTGLIVGDFDSVAAVECAQLTGAAIVAGRKRGAAKDQPWQKVKIDRQIVAIAKVHNAETFFTCDSGLAALAEAEGFTVKHLADLPLPPVKAQTELEFEQGQSK